jgi:hypothetical protein
MFTGPEGGANRTVHSAQKPQESRHVHRRLCYSQQSASGAIMPALTAAFASDMAGLTFLLEDPSKRFQFSLHQGNRNNNPSGNDAN